MMAKSTELQRSVSGKSKPIMQPLEVQQILTGIGSMAARPSPVEHVASPTTLTSSGRASFQSHSRTMSVAAETAGVAPQRTNRISLSFPIQPPEASSPTRTSASPTRRAPLIAPESLATATGPSDTSFLTAIAAQERRVLELKEELQRAEADLDKLKRHWAAHEANKKRNDARRVTKLQLVPTTVPTVDKEEDADGSSAWMQQEMERRKALLSGARNNNRTVFSGSRHTRTLSLLSPIRDDQPKAHRQRHPPRKESLSSTKGSFDGTQKRPPLMARVSTTPDLTTEVAETAESNIDLTQQGIMDHEMLIRTGKKMAIELKDGLMTFWEDLRQATVGDEATQLPPPHVRRQSSTRTVKTARKQSSMNSLRPSSRGSTTSKTSIPDRRRPSPVRRKPSKPAGALPDLADSNFFAEHGIATPAVAIKKSPTLRGQGKSSPRVTSIASNDAWDTWDEASPKDSRSSSTASETNTLPTSISGPTSPRTSSETTGKKDPLPWPVINKLGPQSLRRTASHLMQEWEKSLTPSPGKEFTGQEDYLGLDAEAAATRAVSKKDG